MADKTYLQAASVDDDPSSLSNLLFELCYEYTMAEKTDHRFRDMRRADDIRAELLSRFAALEAERDGLRQEKLALIVQLGTARGLLRQGRKWSQVLMPNSFTGKPQPWNAEVDAFLSRKEEEAPGHDD